MSKQLPKQLYVYKENEGTTDEFINTAISLSEITIATGEKTNVGIYKLVETVVVANENKIINQIGGKI